MEQIPQNIIEKIQKLLNLKEGAEAVGSLAEAENAAAKMQDLLMKWNLDLNQVKSASIAAKAKISIEEVFVDTSKKTKKSESFWVPRLYVGVARNNLCKVWWGGAGEFYVNIIGHSHNIALVEYICDQLIDKIRIAEKFAWKDYYKENEGNSWSEKRGTFRRGFLEGASIGITKRLDAEYENMQNHNDNPYALMIVNKKQEVEEWYREEYNVAAYEAEREQERIRWNNLTQAERDAERKKMPKIKMRKGPRQNSSSHGWDAGYEAGQSMEINKGVNSTQSKGQIK